MSVKENYMAARLSVVFWAVILLSSSSVALADNLSCKVGPITKTYGGTSWLIYSCHDESHVVFATAPGSLAMPFYFFASIVGDRVELGGEGTGRKDLTDAAYMELVKLSPQDLSALIVATKAVTSKN